MTNASSSNASGSVGGGPVASGGNRRNRNRNKRKNKGRKPDGGVRKQPPGPPPSPQIKISIRRIGNPEMLGSVEAVLKNVVLKLVEGCNEAIAQGSTNSGLPDIQIEMDHSAMHELLEQDILAKKYLEEEKKKMEKKHEEVEEATGEDQSEERDCDEGAMNKESSPVAVLDISTSPDQCETEDIQTTTDGQTKASSVLDVVVVAPSKQSSGVVLTARPLYVVPPKKTSRRGDRAGVAYVVLTSSIRGETASRVNSGIQKEQSLPSAVGGVDSTPIDVPMPDVEESACPETETGAHSAPAPTDQTSQGPAPVSIKVDYSRSIAENKLMLQKAVAQLRQLADEDAKSSQKYGGCQVEVSMSAKTWKPYQRSDRHKKPWDRQGSLEATSDYKNWLKSLTTQKEELAARPKPTPGGISLSSLAGSGDGGGDSNLPTSAIVQYLQRKRAELKRKKQTKKKTKDKPKVAKTANKTPAKGGSGGASGPANKGKAKPKKKNRSGNRNKVASGPASVTGVLK